ncbi:MAG: YicC family protein [Verrucomicrobiaceae bacterium]|nr:YicC family protein [Verrucomicrobiaceae bacterium]NCF92652.1 YicC family protein [Verrucomicrobiaceae bacterium]
MTGFGAGEVCQAPWRCAVEIHSVNRKQLDIVVNLPKNLVSLERPVRQLVQESVSRGRISVKVTLETDEDAEIGALQLRVCQSLAKDYVEKHLALRKSLGDDVPLAPLDLMRAPGVFELQEMTLEASDIWPVLEKGVKDTLITFIDSRNEEGKHLAKVLSDGRERVSALVREIREHAPAVVERYRTNLQSRLEEAGLPLPLDDERLLREIGLFAERADISEELDRLDSHDKQLVQFLQSDEPVGRPLDFLAQEFNREFNTIGSKANDAALTQLVVRGKTEVEKIREQVQNVE